MNNSVNKSLDCAGRLLDLGRPNVMGILNVTPDSFSDGGRYNTFDRALQHAREMVDAGAGIIDIGGESTRPGAQIISEAEEVDRVVPVIEAISKEFDIVVSVDTSSAAVIREATSAGAGIVNDVRALCRPGALEAAAASQVPVILMHSLVEQPESGFVPAYENVVDEVSGYLASRAELCQKAGIAKEKIILDPGFGGGMFGKTPAFDLQMIKRFSEFHRLGYPVLAGVSRKSFIGAVLENTADERLSASLAVALLLAQAGAQIIRVHDVKETVDVLKIANAVAAA
ncbi:dihydropteroate synthase [Sansalvadorimonas sp. 2012CJ34-2]|uniref:Dihydropteroate synthase n=1 Tax=Parendozoicomonas callyspongiae TaxID=2942213 RepID=A0ABT0PFI8_9GAMM|nr:dihydropteroate synthase [Sansalvadorimonas sp. 2012CJ34-2]MCL6269986.1 dihydropteroate synthase [Sansalvadorimonas sp. 2012CJ34-2]